MAARRKTSRLGRLQEIARTPAAKELAGCTASAGRLVRRLARWLDQHPAGCRCLCCVEIGRAGGRDEIVGLMTCLQAMRGLADNVRPRTEREWTELLGRVG